MAWGLWGMGSLLGYGVSGVSPGIIAALSLESGVGRVSRVHHHLHCAPHPDHHRLRPRRGHGQRRARGAGHP
eukprot:1196138-Prorocentrum_minimum.AAC.8